MTVGTSFQKGPRPKSNSFCLQGSFEILHSFRGGLIRLSYELGMGDGGEGKRDQWMGGEGDVGKEWGPEKRKGI